MPRPSIPHSLKLKIPALTHKPLLSFSTARSWGWPARTSRKKNMSRYGLREVRGVGVTQVIKDSPAEKAGLKKDDVILRFDGESVTSVRKLTRLVSEAAADQTVRLTIG